MTKKGHIKPKRHAGTTAGIFKVMGLFSGLQVFNIICSIIRTKFVALWLQTSGVGLFGIYNSTIETIASFTDLGLRQSSVRSIAMEARNKMRLARITTIVRKWSMLAGTLGAVVISGLSPLLSKLMFGNYSYWGGFAILSIAMFLNAILNGEQAILQGTSSLKALAKGSFLGSFSGLVISLPLFYFLGDSSVIISIIVYAASILVCTLFYRFRTNNSIKLRRDEYLREGRGVAYLGICMAGAAFLTNIAHLVFMAYLNRMASTEEVGLYQSGNTLIVRYIGLIFSAIGMELFPRLSANQHSPRRLNIFVSHEIIVLMSVIIPVILLFLFFRQYIVEILYSNEFLPVIPMISWGILCSIFKGVSWCMAFTIIVRGDGGIYILTEGIDAVVGLVLNIIFYNSFGLLGIGIAYILWFIIYCIIVGIVYYKHYELRLNRSSIVAISIAIGICACALAGIEILSATTIWIIFPITITVSLIPAIKLYRQR